MGGFGAFAGVAGVAGVRKQGLRGLFIPDGDRERDTHTARPRAREGERRTDASFLNFRFAAASRSTRDCEVCLSVPCLCAPGLGPDSSVRTFQTFRALEPSGCPGLSVYCSLSRFKTSRRRNFLLL